MSKYDCTKTTDFLHEMKRRCHSECTGCLYHEDGYSCWEDIINDGDDEQSIMINYIQEWSDNHPEHEKTEHEKTILEDFKEKYPNYKKMSNGLPESCAGSLYDGLHKYDICALKGDCNTCWNRPLSEVMK